VVIPGEIFLKKSTAFALQSSQTLLQLRLFP
jgi:hypothetical protein